MVRQSRHEHRTALQRVRDFFSSKAVNLAVGVLGSIGFAIGAVFSYADATALRDHGERVEATLLEVHDRGRNSYVVAAFRTHDGQDVIADVHDYYWRPQPRVGDKPTIIYDPKHPARTLTDARLGPDFGEVWLLSGIAAGLVGLVWLVQSNRISLGNS